MCLVIKLTCYQVKKFIFFINLILIKIYDSKIITKAISFTLFGGKSLSLSGSDCVIIDTDYNLCILGFAPSCSNQQCNLDLNHY